MEFKKRRHRQSVQHYLERLRKSIYVPHVNLLKLPAQRFKQRNFDDQQIQITGNNLTTSFQGNASQASMTCVNYGEGIIFQKTSQGAKPSTRHTRHKMFDIISQYKPLQKRPYARDCVNLPSSFFSSTSFGMKSFEVHKKQKFLENSIRTFTPKVISTPIDHHSEESKNISRKSCTDVISYNDFVSFFGGSIGSMHWSADENIADEVRNRLQNIRKACGKNEAPEILQRSGYPQEDPDSRNFIIDEQKNVQAFGKNNKALRILLSSGDKQESLESRIFTNEENTVGSDIVSKWLSENTLNLNSEKGVSESPKYFQDFLPRFSTIDSPILLQDSSNLTQLPEHSDYYCSNFSFTPLVGEEIESIVASRTNLRKSISCDLTVSHILPDETDCINFKREENAFLESPDAELDKIGNDRKWCNFFLNESIETNTSDIVQSLERDISESPHFRYKRSDIFKKYKWD